MYKAKMSCSVFRLKLQCTSSIARESLSWGFSCKCTGFSFTWAPSKASRANWEPLWQVIRMAVTEWQGGCHSPRQVIHSWQLWNREWQSQDNTAIPSVPGCHNHPWSNSLHEYYCRVTQANDTGDIHHFQWAGLQTWTAQHKYTLLPSLLPTPTACCNSQWPSHTRAPALIRAGKTQSLLGTRLALLMVGSCTAQIPWHCMYPTAGLLPKNCKSPSAKRVSFRF